MERIKTLRSNTIFHSLLRKYGNKMWFFFLILLSISINQISSANSPSTTSPCITNGLAQFTSRLFEKCAKTTDKNIIMSSFSVSNALEMVAQGADGETYQQMYTVLGTGSNKQCTAMQFKNYYDSLDKAIGSATFSLANKIYAQQGFKLNQQYQKTLVNDFRSSIQQLNFADAAKSAQIINQFVADVTRDKIPELVDAQMLGADTRLFVVNAIYFKGNWLHPFDKSRTQQGQFITPNGNVPVEFMSVQNRFKIGNIDRLGVIALELPYAYSNLTFVILLPNNDQSVDTVLQKMQTYTASDYSQITENMFMRKVDATIPKFKTEFSINLNEVLSDMGMPVVFTNSADLSGISQCDKSLKVSGVEHKAFIELTEEGTEAAAATGVGVTTTAIELPEEFLANRPFIYWIKETIQNGHLFIGCFRKPD